MIMIRKFIDREAELRVLEEEYSRKSFSFFVIYGRRRVGKTELLKKFSEGKPTIYFLADKRGTLSNVLRFRKKIAAFFSEPEIAAENFEDLFRYVCEKWWGQEKLILIVDEFPFLVEKDDTIPSVFQSIVDENLSKKPNIFLILCGSSVGMMEKGVLSYRSPLYGRRTGQWKVNPFKFRQVLEFFRELSPEDVVRIYAAVGGVPFYLNLFDPNKSFYENIEANFLSKEGLLYPEGEFLLREELRDPATFSTILLSMAEGATRVSEIASKSRMEAKDLPYYLKILEELGIVARETPVLEKPTTKKSLYKIRDNFFNFWFRFVYPLRDEIELRNRVPVTEGMKEEIELYTSQRFEDVCREFLAEKLDFPRMGRQWGRAGKSAYEIDLVAADGRKRVALFEFKWRELSADECLRIIEELKEKLKFLNKKYREEHFGIVAKKINGKENLRKSGYLVFDLGDVFEDAKSRRFD
ncbi:MAG: ATP-binding protein [Candidatus Hadarchaeales archaeon]